MRLEYKKLLYDIQQGSEKISGFVSGKSFADYESNELLKSGVERQFGIMGEALNKLSKIDTGVVAKITDYKKIIAFWNILVQGDNDVDNRPVRNLIEHKLPNLLQEVSRLSTEPD